MSDLNLSKIDLQSMTWRQIFEVIESNFDKIVLALSTKSDNVFVEQYQGGLSEYVVSHSITDDVQVMVYRNDQYVGGFTGDGYTYADNKFSFTEALDSDESVTFIFFDGGYLVQWVNQYVSKLAKLNRDLNDMLDTLGDYSIGAESLKKYFDSQISAVISSDKYQALVTQYLTDHPELMTTVADDSLETSKYKNGSITYEKLSSELRSRVLGGTIIADKNTGEGYQLVVANGDLYCTKVEISPTTDGITFEDISTGKKYKLVVVNGKVNLEVA